MVVAKRIDAAAVLYFGGSLTDINDLDVKYSLLLNTPWDPLEAADQAGKHRPHPSG